MAFFQGAFFKDTPWIIIELIIDQKLLGSDSFHGIPAAVPGLLSLRCLGHGGGGPWLDHCSLPAPHEHAAHGLQQGDEWTASEKSGNFLFLYSWAVGVSLVI